LLVHVARLQAGETVLIHAAAGDVGTVTGQLARSLGAKLELGTVGSTAKLAYAASFGYDQVFLREGFVQAVREATGGRGADVVLDPSGERVRSQSLGVLAPFGRLVVFGNASERPEVPLSPNALLAENKAVMGYSMSTLFTSAPESLATTARQALALVATGRIRIDTTAILPLEQAAPAHHRMEERTTTGKVLLWVQA
jgi:NADPH2:quinone reductase